MIPETHQTPGITVIGEAILLRKPDLAYVTLYIRTDGILLEDAVREAGGKVDQVQRALREGYSDIKDIQVKDLHLGEGKSVLGLARDKANPPRPEVIKGLLLTIPPEPELAVKIVDTACRTGCIMGNPTGMMGGPNPQSVILYSLAKPAEAEEEAVGRAIADAKEKASRIAKRIEKRIGAVKQLNTMTMHGPDDFMRRTKTPLLAHANYFSVSPEQIEVTAKLSVTFDLID